MNESEIEALLDRVCALRTKIAAVEEIGQAAYEKIIKPVKAKLDKMMENRDAKLAPLLDKLAAAEEKAKAAVVEHGSTVKALGVMGVFFKPAVKWDSKKLEGIALVHPEILGAREVAESGTCQLRNIKSDKE